MGTLSESVESGDDLEMLKCLRRSLAIQLDSTDSGRDVAALSRQFVDVTERITELEKKRKPKKKSALAAARKAVKK